MIPDLPPSVTIQDRLEFYAKLLGNLSDQSSVHVNWHTHRQNPSVCWICDLYTISTMILDTTKTILTKSPLDMGTRNSSGNESEPEIEDNLNHDDEVESDATPEYEVAEDEDLDK